MNLTPKIMQDFDSKIKTNSKLKIVQTILNSTSLKKFDANVDMKYSHNFDFDLSPKIKVTDQEKTGRCWIFSALNIFRHKIIAKHKLEPDFELSQAYLFKYDKIEKCNACLELLYYYYNKYYNIDDYDLQINTLVDTILGDGGTIYEFKKLIEKYGVVPKDYFPDNIQAKNSYMMNYLLNHIIYCAKTDIEQRKITNRSVFDEFKNETIKKCYNVISLCIGTTPESFLWKNKTYTPLSFYNNVLKPLVNLNDYICIVNDPRNEYNTFLGVKFLHNVLDVDFDFDKNLTNVYYNVDTKTFKKACKKTLVKHKVPVWIVLDYSQYVVKSRSLLSQDSSILDKIFDIDFMSNKKKSLLSKTTMPNHAVVMTGIGKDIIKGKVTNKYKIENSHGSNSNQYNGFLIMSEAFFNEFVIVALVHKSTIPHVDNNKMHDMKILPWWDVLGVYAN